MFSRSNSNSFSISSMPSLDNGIPEGSGGTVDLVGGVGF